MSTVKAHIEYDVYIITLDLYGGRHDSYDHLNFVKAGILHMFARRVEC